LNGSRHFITRLQTNVLDSYNNAFMSGWVDIESIWN